MARWEPDGFARLQASAFELFAERGFELTTVAEIAERAGLTERTFFNHFADKREVLFDSSSVFQEEILREIAECPDANQALDTVVHALQIAAVTVFEDRRAEVARRNEIVDANPELLERELRKGAALTDAIVSALRQRGLDSETAVLAANVGMLVQRAAIRKWMQSAESRSLEELHIDALQSMRTMVND